MKTSHKANKQLLIDIDQLKVKLSEPKNLAKELYKSIWIKFGMSSTASTHTLAKPMKVWARSKEDKDSIFHIEQNNRIFTKFYCILKGK